MSKGRPKGRGRSFMMVTNDMYELPMSAPMTLGEMSSLTGIRADTILGSCTPSAARRMVNAKFHRRRWKIVAFNEEEENDT